MKSFLQFINESAAQQAARLGLLVMVMEDGMIKQLRIY